MLNSITEQKDSVIVYTSRLLFTDASTSEYATSYFFDHLGQATPELLDLKKEIHFFNTFIQSAFHKNSFGMLNLQHKKDIRGNGFLNSWEEFNFQEAAFGTVIRNLTQMQVDIRVLEASCLY